MGRQYEMNALTGELDLVEDLEEITAALEKGILKSVDISGENMIFTFNTPDLAPVTVPLAHFATNLQGHAYIGLATPSTTPVTLKGNEKVFYIAVEEGDYLNFGLGNISELSIIKSELGSWKVEGLGYSFELRETVNIIEDSVLCITDKEGNIVVKIDENGISATAVKALSENGELEPVKQDSISELYNDSLFVTDSAGNVIFKLDKNGLKTINIESDAIMPNQWHNKIIATYGDSVTALNGGDFEYPFETNATNAKWAGKVAKYFSFAKLHNRGIGSTCFAFRNNGGQVAWCKTTTGEYVARNDNFNYDNYIGNVTIPEDCTPIRGDGSSWLRIKTMFPEAIKNTIDIILVMFHNDYARDMETDALWVENSSVDTEWYADNEHYSKYNGDYNINTVKGGIASTIMKLSEWMPNALIVLMTPISGVHRNADDEYNFNLENPKSENMKILAETVKDISFRMSIPCIDVYGNDCINALNKDEHITDRESAIGIHPYTDSGCKKIARAIVSKLISEVPNF